MTGKSAIMKVEKGMAKKEVVSLLGEPDFRRFDEQVEEWEYKKTNPLTAETTIIIVNFINERVSNMNSVSYTHLSIQRRDIRLLSCRPSTIPLFFDHLLYRNVALPHLHLYFDGMHFQSSIAESDPALHPEKNSQKKRHKNYSWWFIFVRSVV